jgi:hypothetical protein
VNGDPGLVGVEEACLNRAKQTPAQVLSKTPTPPHTSTSVCLVSPLPRFDTEAYRTCKTSILVRSYITIIKLVLMLFFTIIRLPPATPDKRL